MKAFFSAIIKSTFSSTKLKKFVGGLGHLILQQNYTQLKTSIISSSNKPAECSHPLKINVNDHSFFQRIGKQKDLLESCQIRVISHSQANRSNSCLIQKQRGIFIQHSSRYDANLTTNQAQLQAIYTALLIANQNNDMKRMMLISLNISNRFVLKLLNGELTPRKESLKQYCLKINKIRQKCQVDFSFYQKSKSEKAELKMTKQELKSLEKYP